MSKTISYKGTLPVGEQDRIRLKTNTGKTGYKVTKFQLISTAPGTANYEYVAKITKTDQTGSITSTINLTDSDLLAVAYHKAASSGDRTAVDDTIIFDNEKVNQDIFINITDASGGTLDCNYYIELETMSLNDIETTQLTLQSIRQVLG